MKDKQFQAEQVAPSTASRTNLADLIWKTAELLRGAFREPEYRRVILPFTVLRRLDCLLEPTKEAVLAKHAEIAAKQYDLRMFLAPLTGFPFWNHSAFTMKGLLESPDELRDNLENMVNGYSPNVRRIFEKFSFMGTVTTNYSLKPLRSNPPLLPGRPTTMRGLQPSIRPKQPVRERGGPGTPRSGSQCGRAASSLAAPPTPARKPSSKDTPRALHDRGLPSVSIRQSQFHPLSASLHDSDPIRTATPPSSGPMPKPVGSGRLRSIESAADVLVNRDLRRLKTCPGRGCGWLFYDNTKNANRVWCEMRVCGSRAKARERYHRQKSSSAAA